MVIVGDESGLDGGIRAEITSFFPADGPWKRRTGCAATARTNVRGGSGEDGLGRDLDFLTGGGR